MIDNDIIVPVGVATGGDAAGDDPGIVDVDGVVVDVVDYVEGIVGGVYVVVADVDCLVVGDVDYYWHCCYMDGRS